MPNDIDARQLATICGGFQTTVQELSEVCDAGAKNPPAGLTPQQGCLINVANFSAQKTGQEYTQAVLNGLTSRSPSAPK